MILITGGAFQGKKAYAMEHFHLREQDMVNGADCGKRICFRQRQSRIFRNMYAGY